MSYWRSGFIEQGAVDLFNDRHAMLSLTMNELLSAPFVL